MTRSAIRAACSAACAGLLAGVLAAAQTPQQRPPTFRGGAVLVTVDVYPQRDGRIVEGLRAADFEVFEDGKPQAVENFEFVRIEPSLSESERRDPNTQQEAYALAADPHNRVFVVFLDALHVTVEGSHAIRKPLVDTLNRIVAPNDLFGVMNQNVQPRHLVLGRRLLTIEEQLTKHWPWGERYRLGLDKTDPMEDILKACFETVPNTIFPWHIDDNGQKRLLYELLIDRRREDRTLTSVESLVEHLSGMREARTVALVVSDGWRLFGADQSLAGELSKLGPTRPGVGVSSSGQLGLGDKTGNLVWPSTCATELARLALLDSQQRLRDLIARANRANVSFYPVTPAGLAAFDTPISEKSRPNLVEDGNRLTLRFNGLRTLAENTDGIAIVNTNDIAGGMRRIVDDVSAYYLLGYYSTNTNHDGKFRRIEVKVKPAGLNVRARRGYLAPAPATKAGARPATEPVTPSGPPPGLDEAFAPLARLRTNADLFTRAVLDGETARVTVELAASRAMTSPWNAGADVQVVVSGVDGASLPPVGGRLAAGARGAMVTAPTTGAKRPIRITTRISSGGSSLDDSFEVRPEAAGDGVLFRARPAPASPLQPAADMQFRRIERVHVEWSLAADVSARTARLLGRNGLPLAVPVTLTEREADGRRVLAADLNLAPLTTGDYVIELTTVRGDATERRLVAFRVVP